MNYCNYKWCFCGMRLETARINRHVVLTGQHWYF